MRRKTPSEWKKALASALPEEVPKIAMQILEDYTEHVNESLEYCQLVRGILAEVIHA